MPHWTLDESGQELLNEDFALHVQNACVKTLSGEDSEDSEDSPAVLGSSDRDLRCIPAGKAQQETVKATFSECLKQARKIRDTHPAVLRGRIIIDQ